MLTSIILSLQGVLSKAWRWARTGSNWKPIAIALTAILIAYSVHIYRTNAVALASSQADLNVAKGEVQLLDKARVNDHAAIIFRDEARAAIANTEAEQRVETDEALRRNPDWANEPIPADIVSSL